MIPELKRLLPKMQQCELFHFFSLEELVQLFNNITVEIDRIPKGKLYAQRGKPLESLMVLLEGELSADMLNIEGQVLKVENLKAPSPVAAGLLFASQNFLPVQLTALHPSTIVKIPKESLLFLAGQEPRILDKLLSDAGNKIHFLAEKLKFLQINTIEKKLCTYIWEQKNLQNSNTIELPYTIQTLSELFGIPRPSLSRSLGLLVDEGIITREGKEIKIVEIEKLFERCLLE
jgi:CRP/FNR family transcriptional regulator, dissimilatory nitrate respiration regulator